MRFGIFCILVVFASCAKKEICFVSTSDSAVRKDSIYTFENDTILIKYGFWTERGVIAFSIYNKLSRPLYIDWKKSSFVLNGVKNNYWSDQTISTSATSALWMPLSSYTYGSVGLGAVEISKPERISFLAPNSRMMKLGQYIWAGSMKNLPASASAAQIRNKDGRMIAAKELSYKSGNSPIQFRNFLTYSTTENFVEEYYIDNAFYISKIDEVALSDFQGRWYYDKDLKKNVRSPAFQIPTAFYLSPR